jgi:hypothetical protein
MSGSISAATLAKALRPFDVVQNKEGSVGYICEVQLNSCQVGFDDQVSYAVNWLVTAPGDNKHAWWDHDDLYPKGNLMESIATQMCHPFGQSRENVGRLFTAGREKPAGHERLGHE